MSEPLEIEIDIVEYIRKFNIPHALKINIEACFFSREEIIFCKLHNNLVYCFGENIPKNLGNKSNEKSVKIIELCYQDIEEFYDGNSFMFARNNKNDIYGWGINNFGQLGRGFKNESAEFLRPEKISSFDGFNIIQICCGIDHSLALSSDGLVYGWANNVCGQVKYGKEGKAILNPIEINFHFPSVKFQEKEKIEFIHCNSNVSFAINNFGEAFYWGYYGWSKIIDLKNVVKILNSYAIIIILDYNGKVFLFDTFNKESKNLGSKNIHQIQSEKIFIDLYYEDNRVLLQTQDSVYQLKHNSKLSDTKFKTISDFCLENFGYFQKTIYKKQDEKSVKNRIVFKTLLNGRYEQEFEEIKIIGSGSFGQVFQVKKNSNQMFYAIKIIREEPFNLREYEIMSKLNSDFVVKYIDSWFHETKIEMKIKKELFIQMELCSINLKDFIQLMNQISNEAINEIFQIFYYYISCELFKELIECVNSLHSSNPQIIHRDLKPENILISDGINDRFLKLCDFGLSKEHEKSNHTRMVGTVKYMAPEVRDSNIYNTKSDIYSLALISTEIFNFKDDIKTIRNEDNLSKYSTFYSKPELKTKFNSLLKILSKCLLKEYNSRPDSKYLLNSINEWTIDSNIVLNDENITEFRQILDKNKYLKNFFNTKLTKNAKQSKIEKQKSKQIFNNNFSILMILFVLILSFIINIFY